MLGGQPADPGVLGIVLAAQLDHARRHQDAASGRPAQHVEQRQGRGEADRVGVVGVVDHDRAVALPLDFEAVGDLRRAAQAGDDVLGRQPKAQAAAKASATLRPWCRP